MLYTPSKSDALFMPSGPAGDHLFVVLTGISVAAAHGTHLLVNFSSIKHGVTHDSACLVNPGEHPFITMPSYVEYQFSEIQLASDLGNGVGSGRFVKHPDPVTDALLAKLRAGLHRSGFTPRKCKTYLTRYENNP